MTAQAARLSAQYERLTERRNPFLERGRAAASLTIPSILPRAGHTATQDFETPFQSIGAQGVNNLSNKLLLTLMPTSVPFFRLGAPEEVQEELKKGGLDTAVSEIEEFLGKAEQQIMRAIEREAHRVSVFASFKSLVVTGNALLSLPQDGGMKMYSLDQYVVERDTMGNILKVIVRESVSPHVLGSDLIALVRTAQGTGQPAQDRENQDIDLFTCVQLQEKKNKTDEDKWDVWQELDGGVEVPGSRGVFVGDDQPFIVLRLSALAGEDYGRGLVEEVFGDLFSLEKLSQAIVEGTAAAVRILWLNAPNGVTRTRDLEEAPNGAYRTGNAADVTALQLDKQADLTVAQQVISDLKNSLGTVFLLRQSVQRAGERVTATEISAMIQALESTLGGVFALLAQEFQLPLVRRVLAKEKIELPEGVDPIIITGLDALGRNEDLNRLNAFLATAQQGLGPQAVAQWVIIPDYLRRIGTSLGINMDGLIKTEDQVQGEQQQIQQADTLRAAAPQLVQAGADLLQPQ